MNLEPVIGIEVHAELKTSCKMFSRSKVDINQAVNSNVNEVDLAYCGTMPQVNKSAVEMALKAALALNCKITKEMHFDRKNYIYPDNTKGYQITQHHTPIGYDGYLDIEVDNQIKRIRIERLHIEEDTGKMHHYDDKTLIDYNRAGTPLIEIVTHPDIRNGGEAAEYLKALKAILETLDVSDGKMEEGSLRCDANVSVRPIGTQQLNTKTEVKNINSFNFVKNSINYEFERQCALIYSGGKLREETRRYDEKTRQTKLMRVKEGIADYRYFPEPNIPYIRLDDEQIATVKNQIPELPLQRKERYITQLNLKKDIATFIVNNQLYTEIFEDTICHSKDYEAIANQILGDIAGYINEHDIQNYEQISLNGEKLAQIITKVKDGSLSSKMAKIVVNIAIKDDLSIDQIIEQEGLSQINDAAAIKQIIIKILDDNPQSIADYHDGKDRAIKFLVGQIMKETKGQVNPVKANEVLLEEIKKR